MKIIGTLDTRDDGDLLAEVLAHTLPLVDALYVYDDASVDNTSKIIRGYTNIAYSCHRNEFRGKVRAKTLQHRRSHLLDKVREDFPWEKEEIWVVRIEGDRFFLNQTPREIVDRARVAGHDHRCAVQLGFRRHRAEGWGHAADTWPNWHDSIRNIQRWFNTDEVQNCVAFRVTDYADYRGLTRPRPWPAGLKSGDFPGKVKIINRDMAFLEHHGKRSPKYLHWAYTTGSRPISRKMPKEWDLTSPDTLEHTAPQLFQPYRVLPWVGPESIDPYIELHNERVMVKKVERRYFYMGIEHFFVHTMKKQLPPRTDI